MKNLLTSLNGAVSALVVLATAVASAAPSARPNILLFLVDDMGWQDTSVPFHSTVTPLNRKFHTPSMERLAASGMKFTQAYACSVCSPTRVSLITGMNAARHRVTNWTLWRDKNTDPPHPSLSMPAWNVNGVATEPGLERTVVATTLPMLLHAAGYRTIHVGKAHFGAVGTPGADPRNLGFDVNIAGHAAGAPGSYLAEENYRGKRRKAGDVWGVPDLESYHGTNVFLTEALTREAKKAMDRAVADRKPFFLYMAHYAVHVPFAEDPRFYQKYRDAGLDRTEAMYAALVEGMDRSLGDLLANLDRHGIADNTIVVFMSDNGGLSAHARGGTPHTHNAPLSSGKGSAHEGGIREPMIVRWPGVTRPGSACNRPVIIEDFFPTILEMAGVQAVNTRQTVDGRSFASLLRDPMAPAKHQALFWHYPNHWGPKGPGIGPTSTIRKGDWKLIYYHADRHYELFNLADDLGETHNRAGEQPQRVAELAGELGRYLQSVDAQMPSDKQTGKPVPLPGADLDARR